MAISRRSFLEANAALAAAAVVGSSANGAENAATTGEATACPHPFLTPADDFYTVARGNPKPHTLTGQALIDARMTPETWRLEITADPFVEPPHVRMPASVQRPLTLADGTALDLPALMELGKTCGVKYVKVMQCLNIAEPLGQGLWEGVPLREVLRLCGEMDNVRRVYYRGFHNNDPEQVFQSSLGYTQAMETPPGELPAFLAYRLNGEPVSPVRGGPVRMIVPWAHGFKSIKWLQQIFLTNDYRTNDTYALQNNDPESYLKTAAYVDGGPDKLAAGQAVVVTGRVISGLSGLDRVETFLRTGLKQGDARLDDNDPALQSADWRSCGLAAPPDWKTVLPAGVSPKELLGFDPDTGQPLTWPPRYGMASWTIVLRDLKPGLYELYARAVDRNGYAQPEPRPTKKSGRNFIQCRRFEIA